MATALSTIGRIAAVLLALLATGAAAQPGAPASEEPAPVWARIPPDIAEAYQGGDHPLAFQRARTALAACTDVKVCLMLTLVSAQLAEDLEGEAGREAAMRQAARYAEANFRGETLDAAIAFTEVAFAYFQPGHTDAAEPWYRRALALRRRLLGPAHTDVAATLG